MKSRNLRLDNYQSFVDEYVDNIPPFLSQLLCNLFENNLKEGYFPNICKATKVIPVFKSGDAESILNYHPILVTVKFAKIFEKSIVKVLNKALLTIISESNCCLKALICKRQYFCP